MAILQAQDWTLAALRALARDGIGGVRVEALARELGVTKGSFYHHFAKRELLLEAMVELWRQLATDRVIRDTEAAGADARARLLELTQLVFVDEGEYTHVDAAVRDWAATRPQVARAVAEIDARRLAYVEGLLCESGLAPALATSRATLFYRALLGEFAWRRYGGPPLPAAAWRDLALMLLHTPKSDPSRSEARAPEVSAE